MPDEKPTEDAPAPPQKKSRKRLWLILAVIVVVVLGVGVVGYRRIAHHAESAKTASAKPKPAGPAKYYTLDPPIVVNFADARAIRFLQVGVSLMSHDPAAIKAAQAAEPAIRNALLLLFSSQKYSVLSTPSGKLTLQKEALKKVQDVVEKSLGRPGIEALYFTNFVMQ